MRSYLAELIERFGAGWNRFWFTPGDPYPLGLLRVVVGCVALYLHLTYTPDLVRWFGPGGWLPAESVAMLEGDITLLSRGTSRLPATQLSYLSYLSSPADLYWAHGLGTVVLLAFTLGWQTRLATPAALVVSLAYLHRAPLLTTQVEPLVTLAMFCLCWGPAGSSCSLDAWLARRRPSRVPDAPSVAANLSLRLVQVHLALYYATAAFSKLWGDVWWTGDGVWWLLTRTETRLLDVTWLARSQLGGYALDFWCLAVVLLELAFPLLVWQRLARPLLLVACGSSWLLLTLATGQIPFLVMIVALHLVFCDSGWLRRLFARRAPAAVPAGAPAA